MQTATAGTSFVSGHPISGGHTISTAGTAGASSGTANSTATATDQRRARLGLGLFAAVPSWGTGWGITPSPARAAGRHEPGQCGGGLALV